MATKARIEEKYQSIEGAQQSLSVGYIVSEVRTADEALTAVREFAPPFLPPLETGVDKNRSRRLEAISCSEIHQGPDMPNNTKQDATYNVTASYELRANCPVVNFDFSVTNKRIFSSLTTKSWTPDPNGNGDIADYKKALEVDTTQGTNRVNGVDVPSPVARFQITWHPPDAIVMLRDHFIPNWDVYLDWVGTLIGTVNEDLFLGRLPGDVLFAGFSSKLYDMSRDAYEFTYNFEYRETQFGVDIEGITVPEIPGWSHLWGPRLLTPGITTGGANDEFIVPAYSQLNVELIIKQCKFNEFFYTYPIVATVGRNLLVKDCRRFTSLSPNIPDDKIPTFPNTPS